MKIIKNLLEYFSISPTVLVAISNAISNFWGLWTSRNNQEAKTDIILEDITIQGWEVVEEIEDICLEKPQPIIFLSEQHQKKVAIKNDCEGRLSIDQLEATYSLLSPAIAQCDPENILAVTPNFNQIYNYNEVRYYSFTNDNNQNILLTQPVVISENDMQVEIGTPCLAKAINTYQKEFANTTFRLIIPIAQIIKSKTYLPNSRHFTTLVIDQINQGENTFQATLIDSFSKPNVPFTDLIYQSRDAEISNILNNHLNGFASYKREFLDHQSRINDYTNCGRFVIVAINHLINYQQELNSKTIPRPSSSFIPTTSKKWLSEKYIQVINEEIRRLYQIKEHQISIGTYFVQSQTNSSSVAVRLQSTNTM